MSFTRVEYGFHRPKRQAGKNHTEHDQKKPCSRGGNENHGLTTPSRPAGLKHPRQSLTHGGSQREHALRVQHQCSMAAIAKKHSSKRNIAEGIEQRGSLRRAQGACLSIPPCFYLQRGRWVFWPLESLDDVLLVVIVVLDFIVVVIVVVVVVAEFFAAPAAILALLR